MSNLRKFFKEANATVVDGGFAVLLDGRKLKTPAKKELILPTLESAQLISNEWAAQGEFIDTNSMPITRLVNVAIDRTPNSRDPIIEEIRKYASSDLLCYRTSTPSAIYSEQCNLWDCEIEWFQNRFNIDFIAKVDSFELFQTDFTLEKVAQLANCLDDLHLTIIAHLTALSGSVILAFGLLEGHIGNEAVFAKIRIEENYNASIWGYDDEDIKSANGKKFELIAMEKLIKALSH